MQSNGRKNLPALRLKDKGCFRRSRSIAEGTPERTLVLLSAHTKALSHSLFLSRPPSYFSIANISILT